LQVVAEADTGIAAPEILGRLVSQNTVDLVVLELDSGGSRPNSLSGLSLCQQLKTEYPDLPVLLLTAQSEPLLLLSVKESGIEGYCAKGSAIATLVQAIRQIRSGQPAWQTLSTESPALTSSVRPPTWHHKMRSYGLRQIEEALALVNQELQNPNLSNLDWLFWSGRRRELRAARWVVNQLLPTDVIVVERERIGGQNSLRAADSLGLPSVPATPTRSLSSSSQSSISRQQIVPASRLANSELSQVPQQSTLFELTLAKLQSGLSNLTGVVLEIDILSPEKKQDLLYIVLQKFEDILQELRFSQVTLEQLPQKRSLILQDLWQVSIIDFFGKYYTLPIEENGFEVVNILLSDAALVKTAILDKIPFVVDLLTQQLFEAPLIIDNVSYPAQTPEAVARAELVLHNLIIQVANAVVQPLLNEFSDVETIKQSFYARHLISSRELARFRNNLSWRYRTLQGLEEPRTIFESRYELFVLSDTGIKRTSIYAPRRQELEQLRGIPLAVTLAYETRDAIAPRLRGVVAWVGKGVVYVLTQVLGRGIGLVVRGVIQGVGSTLQDTRFGKNSERGK
jgi:DNA-binding NarL/FixJ family response regulator